MVASIAVIASLSRGASYYGTDRYCAKDDSTNWEASAWTRKGAEVFRLSGPRDRSIRTLPAHPVL